MDKPVFQPSELKLGNILSLGTETIKHTGLNHLRDYHPHCLLQAPP